MYELTISYSPTYQKGTDYLITDNERKHYINDAMKDLAKLGIKCTHISYETIKKDRKTPTPLHVHCIAVSRIRLYPYPKLKNFSFRFTQQWKKKGITGWIDYCTKQKSCAKEQQEVEKYYKSNYAFDQL